MDVIGIAIAGLWLSPGGSAITLSAQTATPPSAVGYERLPTSVRVSQAGRRGKKGFGPPPPGYVRIVGHPVPDWDPYTAGGVLDSNPLNWAAVGPRPILNEGWSGNGNASGRIVSIAPHPTDGNTVYIAAASGGVWKTTDNGLNWTPLTDTLSVLNHGFVAVDPSNPNTVYAGTGEYTTGSAGDGLFRSTNAGATWTRIATSGQVGATCSGIIIHPTNSNIIHVTGSGGYYRSTDGGATWSQRLSGACSSIVINPNDPNTLYVGRHSDGVYRSTDGGGTLTKLAGGLPTTDVRRVVLSISKSNPLVVYAVIVNPSSGLRGFYRTADGGNTWVQKTATPNFPSPQGWYDVFVGVHPTSENTVLCGGVDPRYAPAGVIRTTNGGDSWTEISNSSSQLHPDHHAVAWGPTGTCWVANDGGIWRGATNGGTWVNCNATLTVTQNYNIAIHPTDPNRMMTGTQDNGTIQKNSASVSWPQAVAGDGGFLAYDFSSPTRGYTTYVYLTVFRVNLTTLSYTDISGAWGSDPANFIAPLVMDPNSATTLVGGTNRVWRTTNASSTSPTWTAISTSTVSGGGTLNAIAVAPGASNTIYTGSTTGRVYHTTNASTWNNRSTGLPTGEISDIMIDPANPAIAYVSYYSTTGGRIFRTTNSGVSWTDVTGSLPSGVGVTALEVDWAASPPRLFAGSGAGAYYSADGGATWIKNGADLPNVNIGDLVIDRVRRTITAATYGRGAWRADLPALCRIDYNFDGELDFSDIEGFLAAYAAGTPGSSAPGADLNNDGEIDFSDIEAFIALYTAGC